MRVHELAKQLDVASKDVLLLLEELGVGGKTASSSIPPQHLSTIRSRLGGEAAAEAPAEGAAAPAEAPAEAPAAAERPAARRVAKPKEGPAKATAAPAEEAGGEEGSDLIKLKVPVAVADFAAALDMDAENVIAAAREIDDSAIEGDVISPEVAILICEQWGYAVEIEEPEVVEEEVVAAPPEEAPAEAEEATAPEAAVAETPAEVVPVRVVPRRVAPPGAPLRPPVVTVMGHVDHGKTTLLDAIRETNVTAEEAGEITQHIGAYQVEINGRPITFIDTPGHEAFTAMRARGAQVTDIAILVVAADDGVMPQTIEAVDHAQAAAVPIIVAINKTDRPSAAVEPVKQQLSERNLVPEEWGGDTIYVPISALEKTGIDNLLEMILLVADMGDFKARQEGPAEGAVLEARLDRRRGSVATLLVQEGTLRVGDCFVAGPVAGKVRAMTDDRGRPLKVAYPSTPVEIMGLSGVPEASEVFRVVGSEREARGLAEGSRMEVREAQLAATGPATLSEISQLFAAGEAKRLCLVLKADAQGSAEAIGSSLAQLKSEEVHLEVLHAGVGEVTESDVSLAATSKPAVVIGFQVGADTQARRLAGDEHIEIRRYDVIYDLLDDVRETMTGMLAIIYEAVVVGAAEVRTLFRSSRYGTIAGSLVVEGRMVRGAAARVMRNREVVFEGRVDSLRHMQDDMSEIAQGFECGIVLQGFSDYQTGDTIECLEQREVRRSLA